MRIDLKKLNGIYGSKITFENEVDLSSENVFGEKPFQTPVKYHGEIVNHLGVLRLSGDISAVLNTHCARCLKPLEETISAHVDAVLSRDESDEEDVFQITQDSVEVEDILVPELLLQVQMTYLCKEDCKGLCPICGTNRNTNPCNCESRQIDPRFAALAALLGDKQGHD